MKKFLTIVMAVTMLVSGIRVSIDRHYCGGHLAGTKVSLSGKLASCGMETDENSCPRQLLIDSRCCEDQLSSYGITHNYIPGYFKLAPPDNHRALTSYHLYNESTRSYDLIHTASWAKPPGEKLKPLLSLSQICILRI